MKAFVIAFLVLLAAYIVFLHGETILEILEVVNATLENIPAVLAEYEGRRS